MSASWNKPLSPQNSAWRAEWWAGGLRNGGRLCGVISKRVSDEAWSENSGVWRWQTQVATLCGISLVKWIWWQDLGPFARPSWDLRSSFERRGCWRTSYLLCQSVSTYNLNTQTTQLYTACSTITGILEFPFKSRELNHEENSIHSQNFRYWKGEIRKVHLRMGG